MIGIAIASSYEWESVLSYFNKKNEDCITYPYGEYFLLSMYHSIDLIVYHSGTRKVNATGATQYVISHFDVTLIFSIGSCISVNDNLNLFDILIPDKVAQYDCTIKEFENLIYHDDIISINCLDIDKNNTPCFLATADHLALYKKDKQLLLKNNIDIADTEAAAIAKICSINNINCIIIKGIISTVSINSINNTYDGRESFVTDCINNTSVVINKILDNYISSIISTYIVTEFKKNNS